MRRGKVRFFMVFLAIMLLTVPLQGSFAASCVIKQTNQISKKANEGLFPFSLEEFEKSVQAYLLQTGSKYQLKKATDMSDGQLYAVYEGQYDIGAIGIQTDKNNRCLSAFAMTNPQDKTAAVVIAALVSACDPNATNPKKIADEILALDSPENIISGGDLVYWVQRPGDDSIMMVIFPDQAAAAAMGVVSGADAVQPSGARSGVSNDVFQFTADEFEETARAYMKEIDARYFVAEASVTDQNRAYPIYQNNEYTGCAFYLYPAKDQKDAYWIADVTLDVRQGVNDAGPMTLTNACECLIRICDPSLNKTGASDILFRAFDAPQLTANGQVFQFIYTTNGYTMFAAFPNEAIAKQNENGY